jgi:hypothetical protein
MEGITDVSHYDGDKCMKEIEGFELGVGFCLGSCIKYLWRCGRKESESPIKDLGKARWYFRRSAPYLVQPSLRYDPAYNGQLRALRRISALASGLSHGSEKDVSYQALLICRDISVFWGNTIEENTVEAWK